MTEDRSPRELVPGAVRRILEEFRSAFLPGLELRVADPENGGGTVLWPQAPTSGGPPETGAVGGGEAVLRHRLSPRGDVNLELVAPGKADAVIPSAFQVLCTTLEQLYDHAEEIRFFTYEVSERYEEINLLYSISETLGSLLGLQEAAHLILGEVCDVMGARRGSLWVHRPGDGLLHLVASVGEDGWEGPVSPDHPQAITAEVFREGRPMILSGEEGVRRLGAEDTGEGDTILAVPVRYTPPKGTPRTVGVVNLIGRRKGGRFTASDQKLLSAIASQVGAALENNRLVRESLVQERVAREMELAHDLQMKLLPSLEGFDPARVAARVEPAESVGGDFYHFFRLPRGRFGIMIGDVSSHGFPAALIMALGMSAATIYASEVGTPDRVLSAMDEALRDELESTEMYLTLFYGIVDPGEGNLIYANAGHPHAFLVRGDGTHERLSAMDPPIGILGGGSYQQRRVRWETERDLLLLFTDGLFEYLPTPDRRQGEERVLETAVRNRERSPEEVVEALFDLQPPPEDSTKEGRADGDDRTAIVLKV